MHRFLRDTADRQGDRIALHFDDQAVTFDDLDRTGTRLANALLDRGFGLGQRAAIASANRPEWLMTQHAISQAGGASILVNSSWKRAELEHAFGLTSPTAVVADRAMADQLDASGIALPALRVSLDDDPPAGWIPFWDLTTTASHRRPPDLEVDLSQLEALLPFSSGTTGLPKAVRHSHRGLVVATVQRVASYGISDADRLQFFMPLFTIYGVVVANSVFASGASLRLFTRFDPETVLRNVEEERITIGFAAAPVAVAFRDSPALDRHDLSSLRYLMWGATPVVPEIADEVTARSGIRWFVAYAATECGISANPIEAPEEWRLDSPGVPLSDVELRVVDLETGRAVDSGESGDLQVRAPSMMMGYLPEADTADAITPDGWFRTGDIGWVEPEGWIHLTDRSKEMIKSSGFSLAPSEIERVLFAHPDVADCAVYAVPDERRGEAPTAAVVLVPGAAADPAELRSFVAERLAAYKHLGGVVFVDEIPRNAAGKVLRRILRSTHPAPGV